MKVELKIEAAGVQVYAYEINEEAKNLLEENANNGFPKSGMEIVEEHASVTLISHGIAARNKGCKYTASIDGKERPFYPTMFESEDFDDPDGIKDAIGMSSWPDTADPEDYVWIPYDAPQFQYTSGSDTPIPEGHTVIFEIIPYSSGTLHTSFEVNDDFKLNDLKIVNDNPDMSDDYPLAWLYYCDVFGGIYDQNRDKSFDEDTIRAIDYKGEQHNFELDFQGGSGWYEAHEKGEDGWFPSFLVNGWLDEN